MKIVILAGGFGTRISEESHLMPKPMIEIGEEPILWHIMKLYSCYGYYDFIICAGYKQHIIKEFFSDYFLHMADITFDLQSNCMEIHDNFAEPWKVTVVDTGLNTMTGGRIKRVQKYIGNETFMLTYGDAVGDINIPELVEFHKANQKQLTLTAYQPGGRFGMLNIDESGSIGQFMEKNKEDGGWVNAGFMVAEPSIFDLISDDTVTFERYPLETISKNHQLMAYKHYGFWQCMDNLREKQQLEELWMSGNAPWKIW